MYIVQAKQNQRNISKSCRTILHTIVFVMSLFVDGWNFECFAHFVVFLVSKFTYTYILSFTYTYTNCSISNWWIVWKRIAIYPFHLIQNVYLECNDFCQIHSRVWEWRIWKYLYVKPVDESIPNTILEILLI